MQIYDISIAANNPRQIDAPGDYLYYLNGSAGGADTTIFVQGRSSGLRITLMPGQAFRLAPGVIESSWILTNKTGTAPIVGNIVIGLGEITDNRITGSVEVIDGGKNRTFAGGAFMAAVNIGQVAAQLAHLQLLNPAGSGKNVVLESFSVSSATAGLVVIGRYNTALTTGGVAVAAVNKLASGAAGTTQLRSQNSAGNLIVTSPMYLPFILASNTFVCNLREPFVLTQGAGLVIEHNIANTDLAACFEFYEENA